MRALIRRLSREDGSMTILSVYFVVIAMIMGGLAIDFTNRAAKQTKLQTATDAVAHAALLSRITMPAEDARDRAVAIGRLNLPQELHGQAITAADIEFGTWDDTSASFTPDDAARGAVRVTARRTEARANFVPNLMLQAVGYAGFDVETAAVFRLWEPPCFLNGFMARNIVDTQSNNVFGSYFCMHGNDNVSLNNNSLFEDGAVVSMPDLANLDIPASGLDSNQGLAEALRAAWYPFTLLERVDDVVADLLTGGDMFAPGQISGLAPITISAKKLSPLSFAPSRLHTALGCSGNQMITLEGGIYEGFVLVTNCKVKFAQGVELRDVIIASTSTDEKAFNSPSSLVLGLDDNCAPGGGAVLLTYGGFSVAAELAVHGSQVIALKDIDFAAQAQGIKGVSMIAGNNVNTTSNVQMNGCPPSGVDHVLTETVVRMVD
ncbi:pilus assembly protein TadG-related protein [Thalassococcus sp. BH17M4-6]|uniref:pilus assembly protein TadG-related protein n=1 Tax=Thalassococcus sp. BH17M4-6 TaxID=3413148 RepID=UPI003BE09130